MSRISTLTFLFMAAIAAPASAADVVTEYDWFRKQLDQVNQQLKVRTPVLRSEIVKGLIIPSRKPDTPENALKPQLTTEQLDRLLAGKFGQSQLTELVQKLGLAEDFKSSGPAALREKLIEYSKPVKAAEAERNAALAEYNRMLDQGWEIDLWGYIEPRGTFGERHREVYRQWQALEQKVVEAKRQADALVRADDTPGFRFKSYDAMLKAYRAELEKFGSDFQASASIRHLVTEISALVAERDLLDAYLASGSMWVVWTNSLDWVHIGPLEVFEKGRQSLRRDELWGGRSTEPLDNKLVLEKKGYKTATDAIKAVAAAIGSVERKESPLAAPRVYYVGNLGGEKKIGFEIANNPAFKDKLPPEK